MRSADQVQLTAIMLILVNAVLTVGHAVAQPATIYTGAVQARHLPFVTGMVHRLTHQPVRGQNETAVLRTCAVGLVVPSGQADVRTAAIVTGARIDAA